ncbi:MAG: hypothetical protein LBV74_09990 [Tannerella sp.]|jgi:dihydrofolate reductase|nr:hypothetical protein [Tannerella sp.]
MKKIKLYIAASLDQRIAEPDGGIEFLFNYPVDKEMNYGYDDLLASIDTVIMGGNTYREILCMDVLWPYKGLDTYVISHHTWEDDSIGGKISTEIKSTLISHVSQCCDIPSAKARTSC